MLNVAYTRYVNTVITIAVIIVSSTCVVQRTLCHIVQSQSSLQPLPQHPHATTLSSSLWPLPSSYWGAAGRRAIKSSPLGTFRNRRNPLSSPRPSHKSLTSCDPVGWLDYSDPKFECDAWRRWGYNTSSVSTTGTQNSASTHPAASENSEQDRFCIPLSSRCNFVKDCPDGSDEFNCYATRCESEHDILCESDLTCIPRSALCDGRFDCSDKSDELSPHLYCHLKTTEDCGPHSGLIPCDGRCLPNENICDGTPHCSSGIDESYMVCHYTNFSSKKNQEKEQYQPCGLKHFECWEPEGTLEQPQCIEYEHVCDGIAHCSDASDEMFCNADEIEACEGFALLKNCASSKKSLCRYPIGGKIDTSVSSNDVTCPFDLCPTDDQGLYSLEGCNPVCTVPTDRVCRWDPSDPSDNSPYYSLGLGSSMSETSLECVHYSAFCNSSVECSNEADELLCGILECDDPSQFHCGGVTGQCIDRSRRCDGFADCWNASDEESCTHKEAHCSETQFFCPYQSSTYNNGRCVELQNACNDNLVSCYNNIHLRICQNLCSSNPGFCPQDAQCQDSKSGPLCNCMAAGYVYDYDSRQCVDFDECNANVTKHAIPCDQKCTNTEGSFFCSCYPGYFLDSSDNSTCVAEDQNAFMLVTDLHLSVIDLRPTLMTRADSSRPLALSSSVDSAPTSKRQGAGSPSYAKHFLNISYPPTSVKQNRYISFAAFDYRLRIIYFADRVSNSIYKVKLPSWNLSDLDSDTLLNNTSVFINGSARSEVEKSLISEGMAVDYSSGNLYWIERAPFTQIHVISPDAKHALSLVTQNLSQPREISLHTPKRLLFWVDWGTDTIERCNFDGTERKIILATDRIDFINSIHVDEFSDYVYFLDAKHDAIEFVRMDGSNRGYLLKGENPVVVRPFSITMFESTVYWSDWGFGAIARNIHKCNKLKCHSDKSELNGTYYGSLHLTVIHKTMQDLRRVPSFSCLTNNGDCGEENFCLPLASDPAHLGRTHACYRPVILTVPANTTTNSSDADSMDAEKDFEESTEKNEIAKCKSQTENCLPSTRMSAELQRQSKDENYIRYMCYCGPLSEKLKPSTGDFSEDLPTWLWCLLGAILLIAATLVIVAVLYFCCMREAPKGIVLNEHHKKVSKIETLSDGRSNTDYGNPIVNPQGLINGVGTSPHPSPACEAIEMAQHFTFDLPKSNGVCTTTGGSGAKDGHQNNRRLPDFQAQQPQQSAHAVVSQRTPSFGQSPVLQSIPEECSDDSDEEEEDDEEECEDTTEDRSESCALNGDLDEVEEAGSDQNANSSFCYGGDKIPRNYSLGGSSTTALIYPSDDEVFTFDNNDENNLACSKV